MLLHCTLFPLAENGFICEPELSMNNEFMREIKSIVSDVIHKAVAVLNLAWRRRTHMVFLFASLTPRIDLLQQLKITNLVATSHTDWEYAIQHSTTHVILLLE